MRRPQNTWRGFTERVVEPVVLAEAALSLPCLSLLPRWESMGLVVLAVLLCFCVPFLVPRYSIWDVWERHSYAFWGQPVALFSLSST